MNPPPTQPDTRARHDRLIARLLLAAVIAGLGWRVARFALGLLLWGDEAYLAVNLVERGYAELLEPLDNRQVAPPLFLFATRWVWATFESLALLRLPALISGLAAVGVFAWLCLAHLGRRQAGWAVALFAASYPLARYAAELKQYAGDALVSVAAMALGMAAIRRLTAPSPDRSKIENRKSKCPSIPLLALALLGPVMLWLSYPSVAVIFAVGLVVLAAMIVRRAAPGAWLGWLACATTAAIAFGLLYVNVIAPAQSAESRQFLHQFWADGFPPIDRPWRIPWWLVEVHTGKMFGHPVGDKNFGSVGTTLLFTCGVIALLKGPSSSDKGPGDENRKSQIENRNAPWLLTVALAPMLAGLAMAFAGVYPYGVHARVMLYLAPSICLLAGVGIAQIAGCLREDHRRLFELVTAIVLLVIPLVGAFDTAMGKREQLKRHDVPGFFESIDRQAGHGDAVVFFNALNPTAGPGPKIQFELYRMTTLDTPHRDGADVPWAALGPDDRLFALVYTKGPISPDSAEQRWLDMLGRRLERIDHEQVFLEGDAGEQLSLFTFTMPRVTND